MGPLPFGDKFFLTYELCMIMCFIFETYVAGDFGGDRGFQGGNHCAALWGRWLPHGGPSLQHRPPARRTPLPVLVVPAAPLLRFAAGQVLVLQSRATTQKMEVHKKLHSILEKTEQVVAMVQQN